MRRRQRNNPLLMRILGIALLVHLIALPILAQFGVFKKIQEGVKRYTDTQLVTLPPETPKEKPPEKKTAEKKTPKTPQTARKGPKTTPTVRQAAQKSNLVQPKVLVAQGEPGDTGGPDTGSIVNGTGAAGEIPKEKTDTKPATIKEEPKPEPKPEPMPEPKPVVAEKPEPKPEPKPVVVEKPKPVPVAPEPAPVFTSAEPVNDNQPLPTLPDDLRTEAMQSTFVAEFTVGVDGTPSNIQTAQSTGNGELDRLALDAAKRWRFKPATRNGQPVEGRVRLHIQFQVT